VRINHYTPPGYSGDFENTSSVVAMCEALALAAVWRTTEAVVLR